MEIGLFQLENLSRLPSRYLLLDLRVESHDIDPKLKAVLGFAVTVELDQLQPYMKQRQHPLHDPLVLFCENGVRSALATQHLEASGYTNIYWVAGGYEGLLSEL